MSSKMMEQLMAISPADFAPICANCDYQMAHLRTEIPDLYGAILRYECTNCEHVGTIERRPPASPAAQAPLTEYYGDAVAPTEGDE
jgi:hypothetical protein